MHCSDVDEWGPGDGDEVGGVAGGDPAFAVAEAAGGRGERRDRPEGVSGGLAQPPQEVRAERENVVWPCRGDARVGGHGQRHAGRPHLLVGRDEVG